MSDPISQARAAADEKFGDVLPLQALSRARAMAEARGWVRRRKEPSIDLSQKLGDPIGDEPFVPSPGQDVGSGARPSHRDPKMLIDLVKRTIKDRGWESQLEVANVAGRWPEIVGETVAANCKVEEFSDDGVLTLRARTVSWETQIRALLAHLDKRLASELGEGVVKKIVINGPNVPSWKHGRYSVKGRGPRDTYD